MTSIRFVAFLAVSFLSSTPVLAEDVAAAAASRRAQVVSASQLGDAFPSTLQQNHRVVVGLRAVARGSGPTEARLAELGLAPGDLVEVLGNALIVQRPPPTGTRSARVRDASALVVADGTPAFPVVVSTRTGRLGILTGIVAVELENPGEAPALAAATGLELQFVAKGIGYAYFRVPVGRDVVSAATALRRSAGVVSANAEVMESVRTTR